MEEKMSFKFEVLRYIKISVWYKKQLNSWGRGDPPRQATKFWVKQQQN